MWNKAVHYLTLALEKAPDELLYVKRAEALYHLKAYHSCIRDCKKAIKISKKNEIAYYWKAMALIEIKEYQEALKELKCASELKTSTGQFADKILFCLSIIESQKTKQGNISETLHLTFPITEANCPPELIFDSLPRFFLSKKMLPIVDIIELLSNVEQILDNEPNIIGVPLTSEGVTVVGDLHGQYTDLLRIFSICGYPSDNNRFIFNGDFVDRGPSSLETIITLFILKCRFDL